jgi:hypothetical protein
MNRLAFIAAAVVSLLIYAEPAYARPEFLTRFQDDAFRKPDADGCIVCHVSSRGGGPRNDFGSAFAAAGEVITPLLRASFPDRFKFETVKLPNGTVFYFSDPENKFVVLEKDQQKTLIDLAAMFAVKTDKPDPIPPPANRMTFFVTSRGMGNGGHLQGVAGADRHCQALAEAAGAGDRTWRAYLSTSFEEKPAINAGDRIGSGPWYNAKGALIARGVADLLSGGRINAETAFTETGDKVTGLILTGSLPNGTAAVGMTCNNWTVSEQGNAMAGAIDSKGNPGSWNSGVTLNSCSQKTFESSSGGRFYCFAIK